VTEPSASAPAKTVLVVDDDSLFCVLMRGLLAIQGYSALVATDGAGALKLVRERGPELHAVLIDWTMRPMNGRQILTELKRLSPATPVVMMSGSEKEDLPNPVDKAEFPGFLQKPFSSEALAAAIRLASGASAP
jgi:two-component system, cell cycle sensor histidine kinase and response regulator CckA